MQKFKGNETDLQKYTEMYGLTHNLHSLAEPVDVHQNVIEPIENDWQSMDIIPTL